MRPQRLPKKSRRLALVITFLVVLAVMIPVGGFLLGKRLNKPGSQAQASPTPTPGSTAAQEEGATLAKGVVYFGKGSSGNYSLVDTASGEIINFTPAGYRIVSQHEYPLYPTYLMLEKEKQLYSYNIASKEIKKLNLEPLKPDEGDPNSPSSIQEARLTVSFSESSKAYLEITTVKNPRELGGQVADTKSYYYDFAANKLTSVTDNNVPNAINAGCYQYDSKFNRFFMWKCGEGVGSAAPLSVYDHVKKTSKEILPAETELLKIEYPLGEFIATSYTGDDGNGGKFLNKVIRIKTDENLTREDYTVSETVKADSVDTTYSAMFAESKNMLIMGGAHQVVLFTYDGNKQLTAAKVLPESFMYANFMFTDGEKLYYKSGENIKIVDLAKKAVENSFESKDNEEITLISLPK